MMTKEMIDALEEWLSKNFSPIIETTGSVVCRLKYYKNKVKREIAIAFTRYHHSTDPAEYIIGDTGYVLTVPSFWLSIPKELVVAYLSSYIDGYFDEYVYGSNNGNSGNNSNGYPSMPPIPNNPQKPKPNKPMNHNCPAKPQHPVPPPMKVETCNDCSDMNELAGFYIVNDESNDSNPSTSTSGKFSNTTHNH